MKLSEFLTALEKYFKEIFGMVIPGGILLLGLFFLEINEQFGIFIDPGENNQLILGIIAAYLLGHIVANLRHRLLPASNNPNSKTTDTASFKAFRQWAIKQSAEKLSLNDGEFSIEYGFKDLRGMAMTLSDEGEGLSRRFKFIELLCAGTAVSLIIFVFLGFVISVFRWAKGMSMEFEVLISVAIAFLLIWPLIARAQTYKDLS